MKKLIQSATTVMTLSAWVFFSAFTQGMDFIILPANTPVIINLENIVDEEKVSVGQIIKFTVEQSVVINYQKIISANASAYGKITQKEAGEITIEMKWVQAVDDTQVPISGILKKEKSCRKCRATIEAGTKIEALVKENIKVLLSAR